MFHHTTTSRRVIHWLAATAIGIFFAPAALGEIIYVNTGASGANDGTSWTNAYTDLQIGLSDATSGDQIWVAAGVYTPTQGNNRFATFSLKSDVAVYGGFSGFETSIDQRFFPAAISVLSGEIGPTPFNTDNSYHVVTADDTNAGTVLDGFHISGGYADGVAFADQRGAGITMNGATPTIRNCVIQSNSCVGTVSGLGGGLYGSNSSPVIANCEFKWNSTNNQGGALYSFQSAFTLINCTLYGNSADNFGGPISSHNDSQTTVINSILWYNNPPELINFTGATTTITYSCVEGGHPGTGNISLFPEFWAPGFARLAANSPCIDAGDTSSLPVEIAMDLEGNPRISGGTVDMGAYEFRQPCPADLNNDGSVGFVDLSRLLETWGPCPGCPQDFDGNGMVDFGDLVALLSAWGAC